MKLEILKRLTDLAHQKNSFEKEMFREKIFWEKCPCRIIRTGDESQISSFNVAF